MRLDGGLLPIGSLEGLDAFDPTKNPDYGMVLDPGIRHYVLILRSLGVETYESCEGGQGHSYSEPTIRFHGQGHEGFRAYAAAKAYGLPVMNIARVWNEDGGELHGPYWEMRFSRKHVQEARPWKSDPQYAAMAAKLAPCFQIISCGVRYHPAKCQPGCRRPAIVTALQSTATASHKAGAEAMRERAEREIRALWPYGSVGNSVNIGIRLDTINRLAAAYDSHSLAIAELNETIIEVSGQLGETRGHLALAKTRIAELEAKLAGARNEALREACARVVYWRGEYEAQPICDDILSISTQPDRSQARQAVIDAAIIWADEPTPQHEADVLWAVQVLTEKPSADRIDPAAGAMRITGGGTCSASAINTSQQS